MHGTRVFRILRMDAGSETANPRDSAAKGAAPAAVLPNLLVEDRTKVEPEA